MVLDFCSSRGSGNFRGPGNGGGADPIFAPRKALRLRFRIFAVCRSFLCGRNPLLGVPGGVRAFELFSDSLDFVWFLGNLADGNCHRAAFAPLF